jgi:hypothetical protein
MYLRLRFVFILGDFFSSIGSNYRPHSVNMAKPNPNYFNHASLDREGGMASAMGGHFMFNPNSHSHSLNNIPTDLSAPLSSPGKHKNK